MNGQPTVYVSSTYEDLRAEREAVAKVILKWEATFLGMEAYGASQKRALEKCVEDVQRSDVYVGIVGWRYGYCPPETPGVSITQGEYEAAVAAGIPRLVYLVESEREVKGQSTADREALLAFRKRLSTEQTPGRFDSDTDLVAMVGRDLSDVLRNLRATDLAPDTLLPYLCDREPQTERLVELVAGTTDEPTVCLLHGDEDQKLAKFVECLRREHLPSWLRAENRPTMECELRLAEDGAELTPNRIRLALARALYLDVRGVTDEQVQRTLTAYPGPVLVTLEVPSATWSSPSRRWLEIVTEYFRSWPKRTPPKPDLVLLWAQYPTVKRGILSALGLPNADARRRSTMEERVRALENGSLVALLPRVESIRKPDGMSWARSERIQRAALGGDLDADVDRLFEKRDAIPMAELATELLRLLQFARRRTRSHSKNGLEE